MNSAPAWEISPSAKSAMTCEMSLITSRLSRFARYQERLREEEVAGEDGDAGAVERVDGLRASSGVAVVQDVVVHERRGVDHLRDLRERRLAVGDVRPCPSSCAVARATRNTSTGRSRLPARAEDLIRRGEEKRVLRADDVAQVHAHLLHVRHHGRGDVVYVHRAHAVVAVHARAAAQRGERKGDGGGDGMMDYSVVRIYLYRAWIWSRDRARQRRRARVTCLAASDATRDRARSRARAPVVELVHARELDVLRVHVHLVDGRLRARGSRPRALARPDAAERRASSSPAGGEAARWWWTLAARDEPPEELVVAPDARARTAPRGALAPEGATLARPPRAPRAGAMALDPRTSDPPLVVAAGEPLVAATPRHARAHTDISSARLFLSFPCLPENARRVSRAWGERSREGARLHARRSEVCPRARRRRAMRLTGVRARRAREIEHVTRGKGLVDDGLFLKIR